MPASSRSAVRRAAMAWRTARSPSPRLTSWLMPHTKGPAVAMHFARSASEIAMAFSGGLLKETNPRSISR